MKLLIKTTLMLLLDKIMSLNSYVDAKIMIKVPIILNYRHIKDLEILKILNIHQLITLM
jgi:hypothetical protein